MTEGRMLLVDVREPNETAVERYPDAVLRADVGVRSGRASPTRQGSRWCSPAARATVR